MGRDETRHSIGIGATPATLGVDTELGADGSGRRCFLANVPLDAQLGGGNHVQDGVEGFGQSPLVDRQVLVKGMGTHVHVPAGHRGGETHLEAQPGRNDPFGSQSVECPVRVQSGLGVAGFELDRCRVDTGLGPDQLCGPKQGAVPFMQSQRLGFGIELDVGVAQQHLSLPIDPTMALPGFAVGQAMEPRSQVGGQGPEHRFGVVNGVTSRSR